MSATTAILDCRAVAQRFQQWVREEFAALDHRPTLATVYYSPRSNAGSLQYRELIHKDAARLGVEARDFEANDEPKLLALIDRLNNDPSVAGVMIFYPIGGRLSDEDIMDLVSPLKDVEGLHSFNLGYLVKYKQFLDPARTVKCVVPATAKAIVKTLQHFEVPIDRRFVTIVNNSMRVGKPLGLMLENLGATVVKAYDKTRLEDLRDCLRRAEGQARKARHPELVEREQHRVGVGAHVGVGGQQMPGVGQRGYKREAVAAVNGGDPSREHPQTEGGDGRSDPLRLGRSLFEEYQQKEGHEHHEEPRDEPRVRGRGVFQADRLAYIERRKQSRQNGGLLQMKRLPPPFRHPGKKKGRRKHKAIAHEGLGRNVGETSLNKVERRPPNSRAVEQAEFGQVHRSARCAFAQ